MSAQNARTDVLQPHAGIEADSAVKTHRDAQAAHSEELDILNAALEAYRAGDTEPLVRLSDAELEECDSEQLATDWQR